MQDTYTIRIDASENLTPTSKKAENALDRLEKSSAKTSGAFSRLKSAGTKAVESMGWVVEKAKEGAKRFVIFAARIAEAVAPTIAVAIASRKLSEEMEESKKNIEDNISVWSKFKKVLSDTADTAKEKIKGFVKSIFSFRGVIATLAGTAGVGALVKSFIGAASRVEDFKTRLISLTKSETLAAQKLKQLSDFASKAPFQLPEIIEAGITVEAFGAKIKNVIRPIGDLAAFMGTSIVDAAKAFGRAFAAGAGAADILKDRGVLAMVELKAGVKDLTKLTLPEFRKVLLETMTDPDGKIFGATKLLASTFSGLTSMMFDAIFNLKKILGKPLMTTIQKLMVTRITPLIKKMQKWAKANEKIIEQKFDQIITFTVDALEKLITNTGKIAEGTREWWEENKNLIITLGKLYIATKAAGIIIGVVVKAAVAAKILVFAKAIGILSAGTKLLTAAFWLLKPALMSVSAGIALLIGYKIGGWLSDWITGMGRAKEATKDLENNTVRLQKVASKKLAALGFSGLDEFNEAVENGIIKYDKVAKVWKEVKESVSNALEEMTEKTKEATEKIAKTWDEMGDKLKKSFESLEIFPKTKLDAQAKSLVDAFKSIVKETNLSNDDLLTARAALFKKLEALNKKAGEIPFPIGFDSQTTKQEVEKVFDEATGTATFQLKDMAEKLSAPSKQVGDTIYAGMVSGSREASRYMENTADTLTVTIKEQALDLDQFISSTVSEAQNMFNALSSSISSLDTEIPVTVIDNATSVIEEIQASLDLLPAHKIITVTTRHVNVYGGDDQSGVLLPAHASGLDLVPRDMDVRVHRGERIQRADENPYNPAATQVNTDQRQNTFNFTFQNESIENMNIERQIKKAVRRSRIYN